MLLIMKAFYGLITKSCNSETKEPKLSFNSVDEDYETNENLVNDLRGQGLSQSRKDKRIMAADNISFDQAANISDIIEKHNQGLVRKTQSGNGWFKVMFYATDLIIDAIVLNSFMHFI